MTAKREQKKRDFTMKCKILFLEKLEFQKYTSFQIEKMVYFSDRNTKNSL